MPDQPQSWETYEQVAVHIMNQIAGQLGLEHVEGKQHVYGSHSGTVWEIDGKGVRDGTEGFVIIECRRYPKSRQKQEQVAALAYRITDTGANGAIIVSPLGFQEGAKKVATANAIHEVRLGPDSTRTDYILSFLEKAFLGMSDAGAAIDTLTVVRTEAPSVD